MSRDHFPTHDSGGSQGRDWSALLDLYVDGLLSAEDAAAFEARVRGDASLAAELAAHRAMEASLRSRFAPPADAGIADAPLPAATNGVEAKPAKTILARIGWLRIAALVAIVALGGFVFGMRYWARTAYPVESPITAYQAIVRAGFQPYEVCTDDAEFASYTERHLGRALTVKSFPGLALIGWDNRHSVMSIETDSLLATVDGAQVVVFMDKASNARGLPKQGEGLNVFRRRVGGIELVEVSPLGEAKLLPGFVEVK